MQAGDTNLCFQVLVVLALQDGSLAMIVPGSAAPTSLVAEDTAWCPTVVTLASAVWKVTHYVITPDVCIIHCVYMLE